MDQSYFNYRILDITSDISHVMQFDWPQQNNLVLMYSGIGFTRVVYSYRGSMGPGSCTSHG